MTTPTADEVAKVRQSIADDNPDCVVIIDGVRCLDFKLLMNKACRKNGYPEFK